MRSTPQGRSGRSLATAMPSKPFRVIIPNGCAGAALAIRSREDLPEFVEIGGTGPTCCSPTGPQQPGGEIAENLKSVLSRYRTRRQRKPVPSNS